jgi:hypothetical protein
MFSIATASMNGKQSAAAADASNTQLSPAQRAKLLSFAVRATQDVERLPLLVAELGTVEGACRSPGQSTTECMLFDK